MKGYKVYKVKFSGDYLITYSKILASHKSSFRAKETDFKPSDFLVVYYFLGSLTGLETVNGYSVIGASHILDDAKLMMGSHRFKDENNEPILLADDFQYENGQTKVTRPMIDILSAQEFIP